MDGRWSTLIEGSGRYNWLKIKRFRGWLPTRCTLCVAATQGEVLCAACSAALPWRAHTRVRAEFELHASFHYRFPIVECIGRAKLGGDCGLATQLGRWLGQRPPPAAAAIDLVCAIPLGWRRAVGRGYNQALEMAKPVAAALGQPLCVTALYREDGTPQRGLPRQARQRNLVGRFWADPVVSGRRVLVIDDVTTTGATLREASRALQHAGAATVLAWAAAAVD